MVFDMYNLTVFGNWKLSIRAGQQFVASYFLELYKTQHCNFQNKQEPNANHQRKFQVYKWVLGNMQKSDIKTRTLK